MSITSIPLTAECRHFVIFTAQDNDDRPEPASAAIDRFPTTQSSDREHFLRTRRRGDVPVMRHLSHRKIADAPAHDIALFPRFFQCCEDLPGSLIYSLPPLITRAGSKRALRKTGRNPMQESHVFHLLLRHFVFIIYSIRKKGKGASPAHGAAPSFFQSQRRTLPQSEEAEENPRESLSFLPSAPVKKGCLSASFRPYLLGCFFLYIRCDTQPPISRRNSKMKRVLCS